MKHSGVFFGYSWGYPATVVAFGFFICPLKFIGNELQTIWQQSRLRFWRICCKEYICIFWKANCAGLVSVKFQVSGEFCASVRPIFLISSYWATLCVSTTFQLFEPDRKNEPLGFESWLLDICSKETFQVRLIPACSPRHHTFSFETELFSWRKTKQVS